MIWLEIDPNVVKPGWTPLIITVVLAIIIVGLFFSMRRQFRRIDVGQSQPEEGTEVEPTEKSSPTSAT